MPITSTSTSYPPPDHSTTTSPFLSLSGQVSSEQDCNHGMSSTHDLIQSPAIPSKTSLPLVTIPLQRSLELTTSPGAQLRKSAINALPLPRIPSRRPRHPRRRPNPSPQNDNRSNIDPVLRKMARPSPERDISQSIQDPRS